LSVIQEQFLVNSAMHEASSVYTIAGLVGIDGRLDAGRLRRAWEVVHAAAGILRLTVRPGPDGPVVAEADGPAPWEERGATEASLPGEVGGLLARPFAFDGSPLVRLVLFRVSPERHFLYLAQHHLVTDLYSKNLLARELSRAYADARYRPAFVPYAEFAGREAAWLASPAGERAREFWAARMAGGFETLRLPSATWTPRPFAATGRQLPWRLPAGLAGPLEAVAGQGRAPFLVLLCAWACLLARLSGQERFLVGVPLTNRQGRAGEALLGPCVNILPVPAVVEPGSSFAAVYDQLRREMLANHRHQAFPFLEIARLFRDPERDPLRPRLLQAGFTNEDPLRLELDGLACAPLPLERPGAQMDLFFTWWREGGDWLGNWEYNDASFGAAEVERWRDCFGRLLAAALDDMDSSVHGVPLVDPPEAAALAGEGPAVPYPLERTMADLLRESYAAHAAGTALVHRGEATTYADFASGVARVAGSVHRRSGAGGRVVVLLDRSPQMLYAIHGIVHSGNAYVPLGIDWPQSRIDDTLDDLEPAMALTSAAYADRFAKARCPVAIVDELLGAGGEAAFPEAAISPQDSLYILYTSGTTGRPKGAELPHAGIVNRLLWMQDAYRLEPGERCLLKTPYTFDVSGWELLWPFMAGAALVVADEHLHCDPREILGLIVDQSVRIVHFVPSMLSHFLDQPGLERAAALRDVVCSGEALTLELVRRFGERLPGVRLHNLYGPTEASIDVTFWECGPADLERGTVPIGRPIANTQVYVLDAAGRPCPPLVRGEIWLGGVGLAKGYWRRPELTAEKFVPNPFGPGKLYRTGDWGRYGADGAIEYLERKDNQVKIRGVRVELGDIESHLRAVEGVENAVVVKGLTAAGADCLIAYYVARGGRGIEAARLVAALREHLPSNVVPEAFIRLDAFPLSESGKVSRKALPARLAAEAAPAGARALRGVEAELAGLWARVIGQPVSDPGANFFDAGGSSLSLLSLRSMLEARLGRSLAFTELFRNPTIAGMAALFAEDGGNADSGDDGGQAADRAEKQRNSLKKVVRRPR
jgi:amino acid adenylation domain-containing protein